MHYMLLQFYLQIKYSASISQHGVHYIQMSALFIFLESTDHGGVIRKASPTSSQ